MGAFLICAIGLFGISQQALADDHRKELAALQFIESTNGQNTEHALVTSGVHAGTRAGGYYGVMPITAKEVITRNPKAFSRFLYVLDMTNDQVTNELNENRRFDNFITRFMWNKLRNKYPRNQAACAWFWGQNSYRCKDAKIAQDLQYVNKFKDALSVANY
jgi:hypothetical protein